MKNILAQKLFDTSGLTNARTVTWTDKVGSNLGHTVPWSYEEPTEDEQEILRTGSLTAVSALISQKRIHLNRVESLKIPQTIAFTLEARLECKDDSNMPNVYYHLIITFQDGRKSILANFNEIFDIIGMHGVKSRYS